MPVETVNAAIARRYAQWSRIRDAVDGSDCVRENANTYIPSLTGQTHDEYARYIARPAFFEATGRTRDAMTGLVFAHSPTIDVPPALEYLLDDIDADGGSLDEFAGRMVDELQETGFGVILVGHNGNPDDPGTAAAPSGRPFVSWYPAESIIDYRYSVVNGTRLLSHLRVREMATDASADEFTLSEVPEIVVHDMTPEGYRIRHYREVDASKVTGKKQQPKWMQYGADAYPMANGAPLKYLPARIVSASNKREPGNAPLAALAEMNLSHWRTSADYEHALHFCGLPTPYVSGVTNSNQRSGDVIDAMNDGANGPYVTRRPKQKNTIKLGSTAIITFENPQAQMRYLTLPTEGIGALERALTRKEQAMAVLGARMLAAEGGPAESGVALTVKRSGESSALVRVADAVSDAITEALSWAAEWAGIDYDVSYSLDTSFATSAMDAQTITALLGAVNAGKLSMRSFIEKMKAGGYVSDTRSVDDELEAIASDPAAIDPFASSQFNDPFNKPAVPPNDVIPVTQ